MDKKGKITKWLFKFVGFFINAVIIISAILIVMSIIYIILASQGGKLEKFVGSYLLAILLCAMITEQFLEKEGKRKIFYKTYGIVGFLYFVFIIGEIAAVSIYYFLSGINVFEKSKEGIYFALYAGIFGGIAIWFIYHLLKKNANYETLKIIIQPFALIVTLWGYFLDKFGKYKTYAALLATLILSISFVIDLVSHMKETKRKTVDITIEKISTVYDVGIVGDDKIEHNYKITLKSNSK